MMIEAVKEFINEKKIDVLKDLYFVLLALIYDFKDAKYIWTKRDFNETVKSVIRLQRMLGIKPRTFQKQKKIFELYDKMNTDFMNLYIKDYHELHLEKLLENPEQEGNRLSEYLGRPIDVSAVSKKETWKVQRVPQ